MDYTSRLGNGSTHTFRNIKVVVFIVESTLHVTIFPEQNSFSNLAKDRELKEALTILFQSHFTRPLTDFSIREIKKPMNTKELIFIAIIK